MVFPERALIHWNQNLEEERSDLGFLGAFQKLRKATICIVMSACPHGTTVFPMEEFL